MVIDLYMTLCNIEHTLGIARFHRVSGRGVIEDGTGARGRAQGVEATGGRGHAGSELLSDQ